MNEPPLGSQSQPAQSKLALWSLVLGIFGIVLSIACVGLLFAIPAVICAHKAYGQVKRSGGMLRGGDLAIGGMATGYIGIALSLFIGMLAFIAIPNFMAAKNRAQQSVCIRNLQRIDEAKAAWAKVTNASTNATPSWTDLEPYLSVTPGSQPKCPAGGTYTVGNLQTPASCSIPNHDPDR